VNGRLIERDQLSLAERDAMLELLGKHFEGVDRAQFTSDLAEKNWVILLADEANRLLGFITLQLYRTTYRGRPLGIVFSGDTIVDSAARGSSALSRSWIESVQRLRARVGVEPLLWLLITSGFRTYRMLPLYWREFFPCHDRQTPEHIRLLIDHLATERFGDRYDPRSGLVRFDRPQVLRPRWRGIPERRLRDPHVEFFVRTNPGHAHGDELVCLTEITPGNLTRAGRRMVRAGASRGVEEEISD
jgi:hypothetical protein